MDSETPPGNAEDVRWGFSNSVHIIVENGFHETLPAREVQDLVVDFFKGQTSAVEESISIGLRSSRLNKPRRRSWRHPDLTRAVNEELLNFP